MKKKLLFLAVVFLFTTCVSAQIQTMTTKPETVGFSAERLKRIDASLNEWVTKGWMNGAVGLIVRNGKIVYYNAAGFDVPDKRAPLPKDGIFRIASQTKAITSVAVMMLYEEGKFLLDDAVSNYIPAFANEKVLDKFNAADTSYTTVPAKRQITIRDLLTHTSGLGYAQIGSKEATAIYAKNNITAGIEVHNDNLADAMNRLGKLPLMNQPGEKWNYSLAVDVLGYLVEIWSGTTLENFFHQRIFKPLGMNDTYFNLPQEKAGRLVNLFAQDSTGQIKKLVSNNLGISADFPLHKKTYFSGGSGLSSTAYDYAIFLQMLLNNGQYNGKRLLSRNTVRMMTMNQIGDIEFGGNKFGLGFSIVTEKSSGQFPNQAGTFSWGGAFATSYWADPKEKMIVIFYRQMLTPAHGELSDKFRVLAYQALNN